MPEDGFEIKPYTITVPFSKDNRFMNELESQLSKTNDIEKILSDGHILHWALKGNLKKIGILSLKNITKIFLISE